ncbi:MAG: DUF935 family protein, partial [Cohaesibacteraceae bacterium]|nr:DUF935 family protein [Cohaesibacteraceae bacterium]MBL4877056.1 DUF935 family protein [Cohaesibacteraceae bacterium]
MGIKSFVKSLMAGKALSKPIAEAQADGVRTIVQDSVATGLTPQALAALIKAAKDGEPEKLFELAQEMEERDGHYSAVIGTRKLALAGIEPELHAASEDKKDRDIADAVQADILDHPAFHLALFDCLDGLGKGVSVVEIAWNIEGPRWKPEKYEWKDPGWFQFDKKTGQQLRLRDKDNKEGLELPQNRYIIHIPRLKSGLPIRGGLALLCVWPWLLKSYTIKDWAAFCEIFGQPLRLGKYGTTASDKDKRALLRAVRSIARDAAAIIPSSMDMELIQS